MPILATPFADDGELDIKSLERLVEFQLWAGVDGLATMGMASEAFSVTATERLRVLRVIDKVKPAEMPLVVGIAATSNVAAVEQSLAAVEAGATALMALPPFMVKPSPNQIVDFFGQVAAASGVPVMIQDAPGATGVNMSVALLVQLSALDGVDLAKIEAPPTAPKVGETVNAVGDALRLLGGQNALFLLEEYDRGAVGTMPACEFTDRLRPILNDIAVDDEAATRAKFNRLLPLIRFGMQGPIAWAVHKHVLVERGVIASSTVRAPAVPLDQMSRKHLEWILQDLRLEGYDE